MCEINLNLRTGVLEKALYLESEMNKLLTLFLNVERGKETRTFGNKSTSLSFKNKIDLLFDLDVLNKEENDQLLLLMQFRNQFLHNIHCSSFIIAVGLLQGSSKHLSKFVGEEVHQNKESEYDSAFDNLYTSCLRIISSKYSLKREIVEKKHQTIRHMIAYMEYIFDKDSELQDSIFEACVPFEGESYEVSMLKMSIVNLLERKHNAMVNDPLFKVVRDNFNEIGIDERIKQLLT